MKRLHLACYILVAALVLGPAGVRMYLWPGEKPQDVTPAAVAEGNKLFSHVWTVNDPLSSSGDGLGPVFNARSCAECHRQGGVGGAGPNEHNVTTFIAQENRGVPARTGVVHSFAISPEFAETLAHVSPQLPAISRPTLLSILPPRGNNDRIRVVENVAREDGPQLVGPNGHIDIPQGVHLSQRNTPALFGARLIEQLPDRVIIAQERAQKLRWGMAPATSENTPVGRAFLLADRRVGKFGWKAQSAALIDFVEAACANELGLGNPGQAQPVSMGRKDYRPRGLDLTTEQCQQIAAYIGSLPRPEQAAANNDRDRERVDNGHKQFRNIGCAECHVQSLGSIDGIYSDLLLHRMGSDLEGTGGYNSPPPSMPDSPGNDPLPDEWRTPPLWGIADSAPYLHDGRAPTLEDAIRLHGGQSASAAQAFQRLSARDQADLIAFLKSLKAPG